MEIATELEQDTAPDELPPPAVEELEEEWAALSCDCGGDFI